jgi:hypothetical protein
MVAYRTPLHLFVRHHLISSGQLVLSALSSRALDCFESILLVSEKGVFREFQNRSLTILTVDVADLSCRSLLSGTHLDFRTSVTTNTFYFAIQGWL